MQLRLASGKPRVLIFDDDEDWAEQIAASIRGICDPTVVTTVGDWIPEVGATYWDVIVVDVQITGSPKLGTGHAEQAILEYQITSPVIVISGVWRLEDVKAKHPDIFFDFISKDHLNDSLPESIIGACSMVPRTAHVKKMLTSFAKERGILRKEFPPKLLDAMKGQLFEARSGENGRGPNKHDRGRK